MLEDKVKLCELWQMTASELAVWVAVLGVVCLCPAVARSWRQADTEVRSAGVVFESAEDGRAVELNTTSWRLDLNTATEAELMLLPGIGRRRAQAILKERNKRGAFRTVWELAEVPGMTKALAARLEKLLRVGSPMP